MHMIRHQAVRVNRAFELLRELAHVKQVKAVVALAHEASSPVVPALDDVHAHAGQQKARLSWHRAKTPSGRHRLTRWGQSPGSGPDCGCSDALDGASRARDGVVRTEDRAQNGR